MAPQVAARIPTYAQPQLDALWRILAESYEPNRSRSRFKGLTQVPFSWDVERFAEVHGERVSKEDEQRTSRVTTDLEKVLESISPRNITFYHLSCASAGLPGASNTALCIHYSSNDECFALAIPGINYQI